MTCVVQVSIPEAAYDSSSTDCELKSGPWEQAIKGEWSLEFVPSDGMCGWFSLLLASGRVSFTQQYIKKGESGLLNWQPKALEELASLLEGVRSLLDGAIKDPTTQQSVHLLQGFYVGTELQMDDARNASTAIRQAADYVRTQEKVPLMGAENAQDAWLGGQFMNIAAAYLGRYLVIIQEHNYELVATEHPVHFNMYVPIALQGYSSHLWDEAAIIPGTLYKRLDQLRQAVIDAQRQSNLFKEPLLLHYKENGKHYQYYKRIGVTQERTTGGKSSCMIHVA